SWQMAITSNQGSSYLLYAIAAPIIGGVSVFGGRGNVIGILGGVLLLTIIQVGLAIINIPSFYVGMIGGFMIFIAVAIDAIRVRYVAEAKKPPRIFAKSGACRYLLNNYARLLAENMCLLATLRLAVFDRATVTAVAMQWRWSVPAHFLKCGVPFRPAIRLALSSSFKPRIRA